MPIYEYECSHCQQQFDLMQKMSEDAIKTCPNCSNDTLVRLVSAAGFQLKGTGWYATDFKDKGKPEAKAKNAGASKNTSQTAPASAPSPVSKKGETD